MVDLNSYKYKIYVSDENVVTIEEKDVPSFYHYFDNDHLIEEGFLCLILNLIGIKDTLKIS